MRHRFEVEYMCVFQTDDMALRDRSSHCLRSVVQTLATHRDHTQLFARVVTQHLLPEIKNQLKAPTEVI